MEPRNASPEIVANFLAILSSTLGLSFSSVNGYKTAIAKFLNDSDSSAAASRPVKRLMRGVFNANPPLPCYADIWDVNILLKHLESLHPPDTLSDYMLGVKTCALVTVFSLSRSSSVAALAPTFQAVEDDIVIQLLCVEKNSRPGESLVS